ncbi:MAG: hypothetical protein NTU53_05065 [Planctomycetota bacterium]|nr:hypothetical protein [Planctomycetota bacterium]
MPMTTIEKIVERLQKYPNLKYRVEANTITVEAPSARGFCVWLREERGKYVVGYDEGWHEHFEDETGALMCFAYGLSAEAKLVISRRGKTCYCWTLEGRTNDGWAKVGTIRRWLFPFWRRKEVVYRQNFENIMWNWSRG